MNIKIIVCLALVLACLSEAVPQRGGGGGRKGGGGGRGRPKPCDSKDNLEEFIKEMEYKKVTTRTKN